jgi:hypothetical protein
MREQITKLLEILDIAITKVPPEIEAWRNYGGSIDLHLLEVELALEKPLCDRLGVSKGVFPPAEELEDHEIEAVISKIVELWECYHYHAEGLEEHTLPEAYDLLLSVWEDDVVICIAGNYHFEFYKEYEESIDPI